METVITRITEEKCNMAEAKTSDVIVTFATLGCMYKILNICVVTEVRITCNFYEGDI
jgi:hypothetical protein